MLVLATARPGPLPAWLQSLRPEELSLRVLGPEPGMAMPDHLLGPSPRLGGLKRLVLEHTGTMPLFIEEVCRNLVETGGLRGSAGRYEPAGEIAELGVPLTLQGAIASRIDRLTPLEKRLLQVAAAIGPRVPMRLWFAAAAVQEAVSRVGQSALLGASMLVTALVPATGEEVQLFPHELVRQGAFWL